MSDWSTQPGLDQLWADFLTAIKDRDEAIAKMDFTGQTNFPVGTIRWNTTALQFESWNGTTWSVLSNVAQTASVVPKTLTLTAGTGLTGGGDLSANRSFALANMAQATVKGRASGAGTGAPTDLTAAQVVAIITSADGSGSGLDADTLRGATPNTAASNSTIVQRDSSGYVHAAYFEQPSTANENADVNQFITNNSADSYFRKTSLQQARNALGTLNSTAGALVRRDSSGWVSTRVIHNPSESGDTQDGMYIGYGNGGSTAGITRIYGGGSTGANVTVDVSGNVVATGNITAYSDVRIKEDIQPLSNALGKVLRLGGYSYLRKDEHTGKRHIGVIAQEVEAVQPELVSESETGMKVVAYGNIVALLIEALKEEHRTVKKLEDRVHQLEYKIGLGWKGGPR